MLVQVTKCTFHKFGPSGSVQKFDGICVLPLNIINEKIYVFLWFWFLGLAAVSAVQMFYRVMVITVPCLRATLLKVARFLDHLSRCAPGWSPTTRSPRCAGRPGGELGLLVALHQSHWRIELCCMKLN